MKNLTKLNRWLAPATAALALASAPPAAQAAWIGLNDGDYTITLSCDFSSVIPCPGTIQGSLSITGGAASQMGFSINGDFFSGNPTDTFFDGINVDYESVTLSVIPDFRFLSLRLITSGQIGNYGVGDLWWVYCNNIDIDSCTPNTTGTWSAQAVAVPEPSTAALIPLALAGLFGVRAAGRRHRMAG